MSKVMTHSLAAVLGAAAVAASSGYAASAWQTVARTSDTGKNGVFLNLEKSVGRSRELGVSTSRAANVHWTVTCNGLVTSSRPAQVIPISIASAVRCSANALVTTGRSGTLSAELVRR